MDRFREQFGDYFVRGMRTGGQFCAILQIIGKDRSDQSNVKAALEAGGIIGAVAVRTTDGFGSVVHEGHAIGRQSCGTVRSAACKQPPSTLTKW